MAFFQSSLCLAAIAIKIIYNIILTIEIVYDIKFKQCNSMLIYLFLQIFVEEQSTNITKWSFRCQRSPVYQLLR